MARSLSFNIAGIPLHVEGVYANGRPHRATKVVTDGRHTTFVNERGEVFSTRCGPGRWSYGERWGGHIDLIKEAIALGALPKDRLETVLKVEEVKRAEARRAWAAISVLTSSKDAGISLPAATVRELKRLSKKK